MMENSIEEDIKILEEFKTNGYHILLMKYGDRIKTNFKLEKAIEHILSDYKKLSKENEQLRTEVNSLKKELRQKDKIIDLMAETINNHDIDKDICKQMGQKANCNEFEDKEKCKECIKQYFINKAKEIR